MIAWAYELKTAEGITKMVSKLVRDGKPVGFDIETTGLNPRKHRPVMMQFMQEGGPKFLIDTRQMSMGVLGQLLSPLFNQGVPLILGMNIGFDLGFLYVHCGVVANNVYDIMLADLDIHGLGLSESHMMKMGFDMKSIASRYATTGNDGVLSRVHKEERNWFIDLDQPHRVTPEGRPEWNEPFPEAQVAYGMQDVEVLFPIYRGQLEKIAYYNIAQAVEIDMQAIPAVVGIETAGVPVNKQGWLQVIDEVTAKAKELSGELQAELNYHILAARTEQYDDELRVWQDAQRARESFLATIKEGWESGVQTREAWGGKWGVYKLAVMKQYAESHDKVAKPKLSTEQINLTSGTQLKQALNHMGMKDAAGRDIVFISTKEAVLSEYAPLHPILDKLVTWKKLSKLVVGFGVKLMDMVDPKTGRLYPHYNVNGAGTGRMSCFNPNLQQIPARGEDGAKLRANVTPREGYALVVCDFSNIELRILAEIAKDKALLEAFASGQDVHSAMARMIFKLAPDVDPKTTKALINGKTLDTNYRAIAKTVTYAVLYGAGPSKLASVINGSKEEAEQLTSEYFATFKGIKAFRDAEANKVKQGVAMGKRVVASRTMSLRRRPNIIPKPPKMPTGHMSEGAYQEWLLVKKEYNKRISSIRRKMVNSKIQGTSADITKLALHFWHQLHGYDNDMRLIAVVHDEMLLECTQESAPQAAVDLANVMHQAMRFYLKRVECPMPEAVISYEGWQH